MKIIYLIGIIVLTAVPKVFASDLQEGGKNWDRWVVCTSDEQCVAIYDKCGGWTAVNIQFKTEGEEYQNELGTVVSCPVAKMEPAPKVLCLGQVCSVKPLLLENIVK